MIFNELSSGPVIHVGVSATLALIFRLNPVVTVFCGILPDLIDKPLAALGIGGGRYIGHTLLFAVLVVVAFSLWKRKYGLAACIGLMSHLLLDLNGLVPWFYPFKDYNFYSSKLSILEWLKSYLTFSQVGLELIAVVLAGLVAFICWWLYQRYARRKKS
jgi:LexA-binding, inner membrane-associated putative hydrolase